jgi:glycosyltransferase involved in cell wall biosynthesis
MSQNFDLVVASHLRWNFVWQRPQQLLSRLAKSRKILFIEEPIIVEPDDNELGPSLELVSPNITVLAPRISSSSPDAAYLWADRAAIGRQVRYAMKMLDFDRTALWFYTPMPEFLLQVVEPDLVVYDVMDELANFKFAPAGLREQETRLLTRADVVFTGGASLYEAKVRFNPKTHLFPSGVDTKHYSKACLNETEVPESISKLTGPVATYIGVIDERLDYDILRALSEARPDVQFVMAGPIVKVDPAELPKADNIHYLGQQPYDALPCILKGTDVCLMPFARNEATKFISPTKTLEYMATHRPIVSTPIRDVERFYSDIVYLAGDPESYVHQLEVALAEPAEDRAIRRELEEKVLAEQAWDKIAYKMDQLMLEAFTRRMRASESLAFDRAAQAARIPAAAKSQAPAITPAAVAP